MNSTHGGRAAPRSLRTLLDDMPGPPLIERQLDFEIEPQLRGNWCWAAVASSIAAFYSSSSSWTQCRIAETEFGLATCCNSTTACDVPWHLHLALRRTENLVKMLRPLTFEQVCDEIDAKLPVAARVAWAGGGGHFVVIYGYSKLGEHQFVDVADPLAGKLHLPFAQFATAYRSIGSWTTSYFTTNPGTRQILPRAAHTNVLGTLQVARWLLEAKQRGVTQPRAEATPADHERATLGATTEELQYAVYVLRRDELLGTHPTPQYANLRVYAPASTGTHAYFDVSDANEAQFHQMSTSPLHLRSFKAARDAVLSGAATSDEASPTLLQVPALNFEAIWVRHSSPQQDLLVPLHDSGGLRAGVAIAFNQGIRALQAAAQVQNISDTMGA